MVASLTKAIRVGYYADSINIGSVLNLHWVHARQNPCFEVLGEGYIQVTFLGRFQLSPGTPDLPFLKPRTRHNTPLIKR